MYFEREIDEEGNIIRYIYDPNNQNPRTTGTLKAMVSENGEFPNFKVTTIDKKKIDFKNLRGKLIENYPFSEDIVLEEHLNK